MSNVINMQYFIREKRFHEGVIPFFKNLNPAFTYFSNSEESVFILHEFINLYIFVKFIPSNVHTELPTLRDSFNDIKSNPRLSTGEWVVNGIYDVSVEKSDALIFKIGQLNEGNDIISFLKREFNK